jgi:FKBP-type peptidyl-prolyl cis-trans isomerase
MRLALAAAVAAFISAPLAQAQTPPAPTPAQGPAMTVIEGPAFLEQNAHAPGVVTLPSGLQYKIVKSGPKTGASPGVRDRIKVHYEGKLLNGTVFDSSIARGEPANFPLRGLIPAWIEAVQLMHPGDEWTIWAPPSLAYGEEDKGPIPGNSVLEFKMSLIDFTPAPPIPDGATFLTTNKAAAGVTTTASGLQYKIVRSGPPEGGSPKADDVVAVYYQGSLLDGTVFDATGGGEPAVFQVGGLIPGWVEALQLMHPGDQWTIWTPPSLAYGDKGDETIPANSVLEFQMVLMAFKSVAEIEAEQKAEAEAAAKPATPPPPAK